MSASQYIPSDEQIAHVERKISQILRIYRQTPAQFQDVVERSTLCGDVSAIHKITSGKDVYRNMDGTPRPPVEPCASGYFSMGLDLAKLQRVSLAILVRWGVPEWPKALIPVAPLVIENDELQLFSGIAERLGDVLLKIQMIHAGRENAVSDKPTWMGASKAAKRLEDETGICVSLQTVKRHGDKGDFDIRAGSARSRFQVEYISFREWAAARDKKRS